MKKLLQKKLRIYDDEFSGFIRLSLLFLVLFFVMGLFRNYVDTTFLKRYDVEKIPLMLVINGFLTYLVLEAMTRFGRTVPDSRMLAAFLAGSSILTGGLIFAVRAGMSFPYLILFQLLNITDTVLLVYLWNIAGDLFDSRQGKRLFPLITLSQVLGTTIGNFSTNRIIHFFGIDFILVVFCFLGFAIALSLSRTKRISLGKTAAPSFRGKDSSVKPAAIPSLMKRYPIIRYLIVLGLIPNLLLPIFTYQFSVIADGAFSSEQSLASFFGYFRGSMTLAVFVMLLFMGRFYSKVGMANSTLIQPVNFAAIFGSLALSFNIYTAAIGQCTIRLIQQTITGPASKILFGFVPGEVAAWSRVFVRGTVVKIGVVLGSLLTLSLQSIAPQKLLSIIAFSIALYWLIETLLFRKRYKSNLKQVLLEERVDFDKMEASWAGAGILYPTAVPAGDKEARPKAAEPHANQLPEIDPETALRMLDDADELTRAKAAASFANNRDPRALSRLIELLEDRELVRRAAVDTLTHYGELIFPLLESMLMGSAQRTQQSILEILRLSGQKDPDFSAFFNHYLLEAYNNLVALKALTPAGGSSSVQMLKQHIEEENKQILSILFHALWVNHSDMRLIYEALHSSDLSIAVEMAEHTIGQEFAQYIVPLIDGIPLEIRIEHGRKVLPLLQQESVERILLHMLRRNDPLTKMLAAYTLGEYSPNLFLLPVLQPLLKDTDPRIRQVADYALSRCRKKESPMPVAIELINTLREFILFDGMGIRELQAIAAIAARERYKPGEIIMREGESNLCLFLLLEGRIDSYRDYAGAQKIYLKSYGPRSFFGEVRLFTELPCEETYIAAEPAEVFTLSKYHFQEIMKIYPQISYNLCLFFALRLTVHMETKE
jgi:hypothetical protein